MAELHGMGGVGVELDDDGIGIVQLGRGDGGEEDDGVGGLQAAEAVEEALAIAVDHGDVEDDEVGDEGEGGDVAFEGVAGVDVDGGGVEVGEQGVGKVVGLRGASDDVDGGGVAGGWGGAASGLRL